MDYSFGNWVKRRRKAVDLTQQQLAQRVGCSVSAIFKIEADERRPSRQIAELLAEHLDIPTEQRDLFMKVARQEKRVESLDALSSFPMPQIVDQTQSALMPFQEDKLAPVSDQPKTNLPVTPTSFIGREHELITIAQQLHNPQCRLLTLTGTGGIGKTRLAVEAARSLEEHFSSGVYFIALAGIGLSEFITPAIADSVGFTFSGATDPKTQIINYLREKECLLVLDNFEHLLAGVELLNEILQNAPGVKLLATSREPLHLQAEWTFEVQGLPIPQAIETAEMESSSAAKLFIQRARQSRVGFEITGDDRLAISRICQLVEGLPLGIELAAAWVRTLSCREIEYEIERGLEFLATSKRDLPERHRSILAVFDHSWKLLSSQEQNALKRLSVFQGSFTRDAAEKVAEATLPLLSALVNKSLVRHGGIYAGRYDLHELIRQYAATFLAKDTQDEHDTLVRFCNYYLTLLQNRDGNLRSNLQKETLLELNHDIDNLRAAWESAVTYGEAELIRKAAFPLWYFHNLRDSIREGETAFARAVNMAQERLENIEAGNGISARKQWEGVLGELLSHKAQFIFRQGRNMEAAALYQSSLALLRPLDEPAALAQALTYCGVVNWISGEFDKAWSYLNESLSIAIKINDDWLQAQCRNFIGMVAHAQGDYTNAYGYLSDSMAQARALGDARFIAFVSGQLGRTAQALGRADEVLELLQESLRLATENGDRLGLGITLEQMAVVTQTSGDEVEARRLLTDSIKQFREIGDTWFLSHALNLEGYFSLATGQKAQACDSFMQACNMAFSNQAFPNVIDALIGLATLDAQGGSHERSLEITLQTLHHPASTQDAKDRAEKLRAELEAQLTSQQIETIQARRQGRSLEVLVQEILDSSG